MKRILLVEDDEIMRITVADRLRAETWQVDTAVNGLMALALLERNQYHLVLSDIRMPGISGLDLLDRARRQSPLLDVFMMTAFGSVEDAIACLRHGAADYILKPFEMDDLVIRINRIFEGSTEIMVSMPPRPCRVSARIPPRHPSTSASGKALRTSLSRSASISAASANRKFSSAGAFAARSRRWRRSVRSKGSKGVFIGHL